MLAGTDLLALETYVSVFGKNPPSEYTGRELAQAAPSMTENVSLELTQRESRLKEQKCY